MFYKNLKRVLFGSVLIASMVACSSGEPDGPDNPDDPTGVVDPNEQVPDPVGTISLAMRDKNNGETYLDGIVIVNENFMGDNRTGQTLFACIGEVKGLGNVSYIPKYGWNYQMRVTPGSGYVVYRANEGTEGKFYRIYVERYITDTNGGIIGADIKYQAPFGGSDEEIKLQQTALSFDKNGGSQALFFDNEHVIPFTASVEPAVPWCSVQKASSLSNAAFSDGIVVSVQKFATEPTSAKVILTTKAGKTKEIVVSYAGMEPYATVVGDLSVLSEVDFKGGTYNVGLSTNCLEYTEVGASASWVSANIVNVTASMRANALKIRSVEGKAISRADDFNDALDSYNIRFHVQQNSDKYERECTVRVYSHGLSGIVSQSVTQKRYATLVYRDENKKSHTISAANSQYDSFYFNFSASHPSEVELSVDYGDGQEAWFESKLENYGIYGIRIYNVQNNPSEEERVATLTLTLDNLEPLVFTLIQEGKVAYITYEGLYEGAYYADRTNKTISLPIETNLDGLTFSTDADWVSATYTAGAVVLRLSEATENRVAKIICSDERGSFMVHQSKYAIGDVFSEGDCSGKVFEMKNGVGYFYKILEGTYVWSDEVIVTECGDDGKANMENIKSFPDWQTHYPAFAAVDALNVNGVVGWYLPGFSLLGTFVNYYDTNVVFWSSTEESAELACWRSRDSSNANLKSGKRRVVAVNEFSF